MAKQSGYDKALEIVRKYDNGVRKSKDIKAKIAKSCKITEASASTYFYLCRDKIAGEKPKRAAARR